MQIFIQTDHNISLTDARRAGIEQELTKAVDRFDARLTRIEAHLSDLNSDRGGASDKRCMLEARPSGLKPLAVDHTAATMELAISGASKKLVSALESTFGRLDRVRSTSGSVTEDE